MKRKSRVFSLLLAIVITFVLLPTGAFLKAEDDAHVFNFNDEKMIAYISVGGFSSHASSGAPEENRGKYNAFVDTDTTVLNDGSISSCLDYLKEMNSVSAVILKGDALNNLLPNTAYASKADTATANSEFKDMVSSLHKAGLSVGICVDLSDKDLTDTTVYNNTKEALIRLINDFYIDGFEITSQISEDIFNKLKSDLKTVCKSITLYCQNDFSAGAIPSWLGRNYENYSLISNDIKTGDKLNRIDIGSYAGENLTLQKHAVGLNAIMPGKTVITLGEEFSGNTDGIIDWSRLKLNSEVKTYLDGILSIREKFTPIKNGTGEFIEATNAKDTDLFVGVWHNDNDYEWRDLLIISNSSSIERTYEATGDWVVISDGESFDDKTGLYAADGTITVKPNSLTVAVDKSSFDGDRPGDTNLDSIINDQDAIHLLFHVYFGDTYQVSTDCDFDCNGVTNDQDAIYLLFHVYFTENYPIKVDTIFNSEAKITDFNITWHQCPVLVRNYLDNTVYDPEDYSYSCVKDYAPEVTQVLTFVNQFNVRPIGKTVGKTIYYNNEPGVPVAYDLGNVSGTVTALDSVRWINTLSVNVRDLGGWKCDGGTVKYGLLFRGGEIHTNDTNTFVNELGVKRELNLRGSETSNEVSPFGEDITFYRPPKFKQYTLSAYQNPYMKEAILFCMDGAIKGEPVYIHCLVGADRTGTLAFLLEQVLGMDQSDIDKDYELTMFHTTSMDRLRCNSSNYLRLVNELKAKPGDTMRDKAINYLVSIGISLDTINAFRKAMINGNPEIIK